MMGTPVYMSPEQCRGAGSVDHRSDIYSMGCVLYHMLTGRPPFQAASPVDTVLMVLEQDPVPPRMLNPKADSDLEMIALRCLQKPMDLRYASAAALADLKPISTTKHLRPQRTLHEIIALWLRGAPRQRAGEGGLLWMWHSLVLFIGLPGDECCAGSGSKAVVLHSLDSRPGNMGIRLLGMRRRMGPVTFVGGRLPTSGREHGLRGGSCFRWVLAGPAGAQLSPVLGS
jgi:serine/threonine-protein kinase